MIEYMPDKLKFSIIVTYDNYIVRDHRLQGVRILPGVTFLDIIYRFLIMRGYSIQNVEIRNVLFQQPVIATPEFDQKVTITVERINNFYRFTGMSYPIKNGIQCGEWTINLTGEIHFSEFHITKRIDIKKLINECEREFDIDKCYSYTRKSGVDHYEFMKLLGTVYSGKGYNIVDASLGELAQRYKESYYLHPGILDGSTVVSGNSIRRKAETEKDNTIPYIPIYINAFKAFNSLNTRNFVYIDESKIEMSSSQDILYFDVEIYSEDGVLNAYYRRFGCKRVRFEGQLQNIQTQITGFEMHTGKSEEEADQTANKSRSESMPLRYRIEQDICSAIAEMLEKRAEDIDKNKEFYELGLDSKNIINMVENIENKMNIKLYPTLLFEYTNVGMVAEYIEREHGGAYSETQGDRVEEPQGVPSSPVQTSEDNTQNMGSNIEKPAEVVNLSDVTLRDLICEDIKTIIAELAGVEYENIDTGKEFYELGLDSRNIINMVECLENKMEIKLYPTLLFEYTSIEKLAEYIENEFGDSCCLSGVSKRKEERGLKVVAGNEESLIDADPAVDFLYIARWVPSVVEKKISDESFKTQNVLLIYSKEGEKLAGSIASKYEDKQVYKIIVSDKDMAVGQQTWKVNSHRQDAVKNKVEEIGDIDRIIFLGGIQPAGYSLNDMSIFDECQKNGILSLFRTVNAFIELKRLTAVKKITVVTNNVWQVLQSEVSWPFSGSIWGFVKSFAKEYPGIEMNIIDIDLVSDENDDEIYRAAEHIMQEPFHKNGEEIAFREGIRYKRVIEPITIENQENNTFKKNGVYIIIGGTGGIGLETAEYLAGAYSAKLVLISRNHPDGMQMQKIERIKELGGEVVHIEADISDYKSLGNAIKKVKSIFGKINGCIHSAIVLRDKLIKLMTEETLLEVLSPKALGTVALYNALKDEELDFVLFYSSAQSFMGSFGQSNYAAACTCKDAIAASWGNRANYPVSIINWGYWGSIGVVASDEYRNKITAGGIGSIEPEEGMKIVSNALSRKVGQLLAIKLDERHLENAGIKKEDQNKAFPLQIPSMIKEISAKTQLEVSSSDLLDRHFDGELWTIFDRIQQCLLLQAFRKMGVFICKEEQYDKLELSSKLGIIKSYDKLFNALLDILERGGFIRAEDNEIEVLPVVESYELVNELAGLEKSRDELLRKYDQIGPYCELLWECVHSYPQVLTGRKDHMTVMFPGGATHMVENIYKGNAITDFYNLLVADIIQKYVEARLEADPKASVSILEIGAGTGGTSIFVAKALKKYSKDIKYFYTDLALQFTRYKDSDFKEEYAFVEFKVLDIENKAVNQGFEKNSMDIVFASNVLHATKSIHNSVANVKQVLKANGLFIVNEATQLNDFVTLTFGLTSGWWLYEDEILRIPGSPLLLPEQWKRVLKLCGFKNVCSFELCGREKNRAGQTVIVGESDGYVKDGEYFSSENIRSEAKDLKLGLAFCKNHVLEKTDTVLKKILEGKNVKLLHVFDLNHKEVFLSYWKRLRARNLYPQNKNFTYFLEDYGNKKGVLKCEDIDLEEIMGIVGQDRRLFHLVVSTATSSSMEVMTIGDGIPVVLISGFGLTSPQWFYQIKDWCAKYRIISIHMPGFGASIGGDDLSLSGISRELIEVLEELGITERIHVVGTSWGGMIAQTVAREYPDRVCSLTLSCSFSQYNGNKLGKTLHDKMIQDLKDYNESYINLIFDSEFVNPIARKYSGMFSNGFSIADNLADIISPTLVIAGGKDTIININESKKLYSGIKNSQYYEIPEAGHSPHVTHNALFNTRVSEFIDQSENYFKIFQNVFSNNSDQLISINETIMSNNRGIFNVLMDKSGIQSNLLKYQVNLLSSGKLKSISTAIKIMSSDREYNADTTKLIGNFLGEKLWSLFEKNTEALGYNNNIVREKEFYKNIDKTILKYCPEIYGIEVDERNQREMVFMEDISGTQCFNVDYTENSWLVEDIKTVLIGLSEIHAVYLNKYDAIPESIMVSKFDANAICNAKDLFMELLQCNKYMYKQYTSIKIQEKCMEFIERIEENTSRMAAFPMTLTHNDFNPRNICIRRNDKGNRLVAYDWELIRFQNPQHDLVEFLVFSMDENTEMDTFISLVDMYAENLFKNVNIKISREEFMEVLLLNLLEFAVIRLNMYFLGHAFAKFTFIIKICRNLTKTIEYLYNELQKS